MALDLVKTRLDIGLEKVKGHFQIIRECIG
jgi:hypothetical protein